jgi:Tol biopolymer transport system component/DNA-binding winged helix-turn-helix (wHTH) protein
MATVAEQKRSVLKVLRKHSEENLNAPVSGTESLYFQFGDFRIDIRERRLMRGSAEISLAPKVFDLLRLFVEHPGQLLTKDVLLEKLWPQSFVEEGTLAVYVSILRKALDDTDVTSRHIETVPKSGYRFTPKVTIESPPSTGSPKSTPRFRGIGIVILACISLAALGLNGVRRQHPVFTGYALEGSRPLTSSPGIVSQPALSADGQSLAYVWEAFDGAPINVYVQNIAGTDRQKLTDGPGNSFAPAFSPDGREIAYLHMAQDGAPVEVILVDSRSTLSRRKLADLGRYISTQAPRPLLDWSPDGRFLLTSASSAETPFPSLVLISTVTGEKRFLTHAPVQSADGDARFSWDGKTIAFRRCLGSSMDDIYAIPAQGGTARRLTSDIRRIRGLTWSSDGRSLIVASNRATALTTLWRVFLDGQPPVELTTPVVHASAPVVARDFKRLAFVSEVNDVNIWKASLTGDTVPKPVVESTFLDSGPDISPDGSRIAFRSDRTGSDEIWLADSEGRNPRQLTHFGGPLAGCPRWSPDGQWIAFDSRESGNADIYTLRVDNGMLRRVTTAPSDEVVPSWSRDGQFIYFTSNRTGRQEIWKIPAGGGLEKQITTDGGFGAVESADGRMLYYVRDMATTSIWRMPVPGGKPAPVIESIGPRFWGHWAVSAHYLTFLHRASPDSENAEILRLDLATGAIHRLAATVRAPESGSKGFSVSPDERWVLYSQRDIYQTSVMLAEGSH